MFSKRSKLKYEPVEHEELVGSEKVDVNKEKVFQPGSCFWSSLFTTVLISIYYVPSICLTFYQRWLLQSFHFPLTTVLIHMMVKFLLAFLVRIVLERRLGKQRILLGWKEYIAAVAPMGVFSGLDIGLSNWGLELIQVSLYTMTKSTTIVFILFFSILFKLEKKSWSLVVIVTMITIGLILFTYKSTQFNLLGFLLLLCASASSGIRWTCVQLLLQKSKMGMRNPIDMIYHMQPWMIASILPFALIMEGTTIVTNCNFFRCADSIIVYYTTLKILLGAFIAFFMEIAEVLVVSYTSSLTLSIAGIVKEIFVLVLAVEWDGDQLSLVNILGLVICMLGITSHVIHKLKTTASLKPVLKSYESEDEHDDLGENLINGKTLNEIMSSDSDEQSDSQVLFDILNRRER